MRPFLHPNYTHTHTILSSIYPLEYVSFVGHRHCAALLYINCTNRLKILGHNTYADYINPSRGSAHDRPLSQTDRIYSLKVITCYWLKYWKQNTKRYTTKCTGHLQPRKPGLPGLPLSSSPFLFSGSGPFGLPPVPWTEETIEWSPFLVRGGRHLCCGDLVGRTTFWIFFWAACKS